MLLVLAALSLRLPSWFDQLWLDELSTLALLPRVASWKDIGFGLHHDNNHYLMTTWAWLVGGGDRFLLRLPSLVAGVVSVALAMLLTPYLVARAAPRRRVSSALCALALCTFSYPLVLYAGEARGYALMVAALFTYLLLIERWLTQPTRWQLLAVWLVSSLGVLSHLTFVIGVPMGAIFLVARLKDWRIALGAVALLHLPLALLMGVLFLWDLRFIPPGSGPLRGYFEVIVETISVAVGGPLPSAAMPSATLVALLVAAAVLVLLLAELWQLWREDQASALALFVGVFLAPVLLLLVAQPRVLFPRYLLASMVLGYLVLASQLARQWERGAVGKVTATVLLIAFVSGSLRYSRELAYFGRGPAQPLVRYLATNGPDEAVVTVSSDQDYWAATTLQYAAREWGIALRYVSSEDASSQCSTWHLIQTQDRYAVPQSMVRGMCGDRYQYDLTVEAAPLSGWRTFVYRHQMQQ